MYKIFSLFYQSYNLVYLLMLLKFQSELNNNNTIFFNMFSSMSKKEKTKNDSFFSRNGAAV